VELAIHVIEALPLAGVEGPQLFECHRAAGATGLEELFDDVRLHPGVGGVLDQVDLPMAGLENVGAGRLEGEEALPEEELLPDPQRAGVEEADPLLVARRLGR
jgi:hypothetical protein